MRGLIRGFDSGARRASKGERSPLLARRAPERRPLTLPSPRKAGERVKPHGDDAMPHEHTPGPGNQILGWFRLAGVALGWALAGAAVSAGVRAIMLAVAYASPLGTDEPLSAAIMAEVVGLCAGIGLLVGALSGSQLGPPVSGTGQRGLGVRRGSDRGDWQRPDSRIG